MNHSMRCILILTFSWLGWASGIISCHAETITVDLRQATSDPLIDLVPPPAGSPDRIQVTGQGLRITQSSDVPGRTTGVTGFKSMIAASGDFTVTLDLRINKLSGPSDGWGHGLIFAIFLDDEVQTALKLNQVAYPGQTSAQIMVEKSDRSPDQPIYQPGPESFRDGKLIVQRIGREVLFFIEPAKTKERQEVARLTCPAHDIRTVEVWSTRVDKGNAPADILLRSLEIEADTFYAFKRPVLGWLTWWQALMIGNVALIVGLLGYRVWSNRHAN